MGTKNNKKTNKGKVNTDSVNAIVRTVINVSVNVLIIGIFVLVLINFSGKAFEFGKAIFTEVPIAAEGQEKDVVVTIPKDASNSEVAEIIYEEGLCEDKNVFLIKLLLSDYKDEVIPGTYKISTGNTPEEIIAIIGTEVVEEEADKK